MLEVWLVLSFTTMVIWGVGQVMAKVGTSGAGTGTMMLLVAVIEIPLYGAWFLLFREDVSLTAYSLGIALVAAVFGISGYLLFFEAINQGNVTIVGTICAAYPCVTVVTAIFFLGEELTRLQLLGVVLILLGIVGLSIKREEVHAAFSRLGLIFALGCFMTWGLWGVSAKVAVDLIGDNNLVGFYAGVSPTVGLLYWFLRLRGHPERSLRRLPNRALITGAAAVAMNGLGVILMTRALVEGPASIVVLLSGAYPVVTVLVARLALHEVISKYHIIPLAMVVLGLPLVSA